MANSRKSRRPNKPDEVERIFERALGDILARVCICAPDSKPAMAVAYSGGLDSTVLLHLASRYATERGLPLYAFHVHHGLSANADVWLRHCAAQAVTCGAFFVSREVTLTGIEECGVEESARIARYTALGEMCRQHEVPLLLTAHHQDDQAETVVLQLLRGAGLPGLSGMAGFQAEHELLGEGVALGRPLLEVSRAALERTREHLALTHVEDESNLDLRYARNRLRHKIFPFIEQHASGFAPLVARTAGHMQAAQNLLSELAQMDLQSCQADTEARALHLPALARLSDQRIDNLLRHWLHRAGLQAPSSARLKEIREQMLTAAGDTHPFFDFGHMRLHRVADRLELHPALGSPPDTAITLRWAGEERIYVPAWQGWLHFERGNGPGLNQDALANASLQLCPRAGSERLKLAGNRPSRGLKQLFQEAGIAPHQRQWLPLVYLDSMLVFGAGLGMDVRQMQADGSCVLRWQPTWSAAPFLVI